MKTIKIAFVALSLILVSSTLFAYGRGYNKNNYRNNKNCTSQIPNLTSEQISSINNLKESHYTTIDKLRVERRSTTDERTKTEIRLKMLDAKEQHQKEVISLLNKEQQEAYSSLSQKGQNKSRNSNFRNNKNQRNSNQQGNRNGKGNGNGRNNNCKN